jgi:hypothetical protein
MVGKCERCASAEYALMCDSCNHKLFSSQSLAAQMTCGDCAAGSSGYFVTASPTTLALQKQDLKGQPRTIGAGTEAIC